ncbi:MAG TPA: aminoacyl-tRNA hydrolase, partial [Flavobacteriales bacterium]|nr:aminoacyl-tRNA hydrolase [Flavobacteriales bacterium]
MFDSNTFEKELKFRTSRSGGPGGQSVNKTETRVEVMFDIAAS